MWKLQNKQPRFWERTEETQPKGGVVAVWGAPGAGKTTLAVEVALGLAQKEQDVVLVFCDATTPMLPCVIPPSQLEGEGSLGRLLGAPCVTEHGVLEELVSIKGNPHLVLLGWRKGENVYTYADVEQGQVESFLQILRQMATYVVLDCSSYLTSDVLSSVALLESDEILEVLSCELKTVSYLSSQMRLLEQSGIEREIITPIGNRIQPYHGVPQMASVVGKFAFQVPYSKEVEGQWLEGNLFAPLVEKESRGFRKEIRKLVGEVASR